MTTYTKVWKINGQLVVAHEVEDAIELFKKCYDGYEADVPIRTVELIVGNDNNDLAILSVDETKDDVS